MISKKNIIRTVAVAMVALAGAGFYQYDKVSISNAKHEQQIEKMSQENENLLIELNATKQSLAEQQEKNKELAVQINELQEQAVSTREKSSRANEVSRGSRRSMTLEVSAYSADGNDPYCGGSMMANGDPVHVGAAALNGVPFGTRIYVPFLDTVVTVKDRCGYDGVLDIYCDTTTECYNIGRRMEEVIFLD